jgi:hypothetical protein
MVIDIAKGVGTGIASQKATQKIDELTRQGPTHEENILSLLSQIRDALSPKEKINIDIPVLLQPAPYEYLIDEDWMGKPHFCIFFPAVTSVSLFTEGAGLVVKNSIAGWMQIDLRGRLCSGDATSHQVILSYREDALGASF